MIDVNHRSSTRWSPRIRIAIFLITSFLFSNERHVMLTRILFCFWFSTYPLEFIYFCRSNDIDPVLVSRTCSHKRIVNRSINVLPPSLFFPLSSTILSLLGRKWELGDPLETNLIKDRRTRTFNFNFRQHPLPQPNPPPHTSDRTWNNDTENRLFIFVGVGRSGQVCCLFGVCSR